MTKSIFVSKTIWRTVLAGAIYLAPVTVLPSVFNPTPVQASQRSLTNMLNALGIRESRSNYSAENTLGFMGKYQFGEAVLIDLGYYRPRNCTWYGRGANKNTWNGTWRRGIQSKQNFKRSGSVQERAIREAFGLNWHYINSGLNNNAVGYMRRRRVSLSGILAGAHLVGYQGAIAYLKSGEVQRDPYGVPITEYIKQFGGYKITPQDFGGRRAPKPSGC
ncbi:MAG: hypothetical protein WBA07_30410 [Rivularia sp. (in: cyanobacteria)]